MTHLILTYTLLAYPHDFIWREEISSTLPSTLLILLLKGTTIAVKHKGQSMTAILGDIDVASEFPQAPYDTSLFSD